MLSSEFQGTPAMGGMPRRIRKPAVRGALLGLACALVCWLLSQTAALRVLEEWSLDNGFVVRGRRATRAHVVVVGIEESCFQQLGKPLLFSSPELAEAVRYLHQEGAVVIGVDLLFPEGDQTLSYLLPGQPGDAESMGRAVGESGNVVLPLLLRPAGEPLLPMYEWQPPIPAGWTELGFVNLTIDPDTYTRRQRLRIQDGGRVWPGFALAMFGRAEGLSEAWFTGAELQLDGRPIPLDSEGALRINYVGPPGTVPSVTFSQLLSAARGEGKVPVDLSGAVVVIGVSAASDPDRHPTPYLNQSLAWVIRSAWLGRSAELMVGAEIHAHVVATLIDRAFISTPWWLSTPLVVAVSGIVLGAVMARSSLAVGLVFAFGHHLAWRVCVLLAFWVGHWRVESMAVLLLGGVVYGMTFAFRWRWMRRMLGLVKSEAIARAMEADPSQLDRIGGEREVTVLFSDIRDFTPYAERHAASQVVALLNEYFTAIVPRIERLGGTISQYNGDGVMVLFGALEAQPDHASRALAAGMAMIRRVHQLEARWRELGAAGFRTGVGMHTGRAVVGAVGSPRRLDYTAHGDTVNTASRIEAANKALGTELLISETVFAALSAEERERLASFLTPHSLALKGKRDPLAVYAVSVPQDSRSDPLPGREAVSDGGGWWRRWRRWWCSRGSSPEVASSRKTGGGDDDRYSGDR